MNRVTRLMACVLLAAGTLAPSGCDGGIGMSVPASGARWSGPGPSVLVAGGPQ
jgi:hypothetical protein